MSQRDCEIKRAAPAFNTFRPYFPPMSFDEVTGDSQAQTGSTAGTRPVHFIETLEYPW